MTGKLPRVMAEFLACLHQSWFDEVQLWIPFYALAHAVGNACRVHGHGVIYMWSGSLRCLLLLHCSLALFHTLLILETNI